MVAKKRAIAYIYSIVIPISIPILIPRLIPIFITHKKTHTNNHYSYRYAYRYSNQYIYVSRNGLKLFFVYTHNAVKPLYFEKP